MTREEVQKIFDYENHAAENMNMSDIERYIIMMDAQQTDLIRIQQVLDRTEELDSLDPEEIEELYEEQEFHQNLYEDWYAKLKESMKTKDKAALKEYLDLIQKDADEQFAANKMPLYLPPEKRGELLITTEDSDAYYAKRDLKAKCDCIRAAKIGLHFMLKKAEMQ